MLTHVKSDQIVRGSVVLPAGTGKSVRVAVFAQGERLKQLKRRITESVGFRDLATEIKAGNLNFDVVICNTRCNEIVGQLGQVLGPVV